MFTTRGHNGSHHYVDTASMHRASFGFTEQKQRTSADMRQPSFGPPVSYSPASGTRSRVVPYNAPLVDMQKAFDRPVQDVGSINTTGRHGIPLIEHKFILGRSTRNNAG